MTEAFLRIPPFPGHRAQPIAKGNAASCIGQSDGKRLAELLRKHRVGGSFWAAQPNLPAGRDVLLAPGTIDQSREMMEAAQSAGVINRCAVLMPKGRNASGLWLAVPIIEEPVDPWHLAAAAAEIWAGADREIAFVAALAGTGLHLFGEGRFSGCDGSSEALEAKVAETLGCGLNYRCPFTGAAISPFDAIELLASWRGLIDRNRKIAGAAGVAAWKRPTVEPLLWNGRDQSLHGVPRAAGAGSEVIVWKSRASAALLNRLDQSAAKLVEVEDGMIRGPGLGANCVPPLSIVVDSKGIYFDPSAPSDLEEILQTAEMDKELLDRAARLRKRVVETGISKYGAVANTRMTPDSGRRRVLVVGQVEDDRSVLSGGAGQTNLELIQRTRSIDPDAWIIYRPHPDVEAGHRKGHVPDELALRHADEINRNEAIASLIESVDCLHCITSLAGFEALMRGKSVTTHGVPFYAGWGLTRDLAEIPARRTRKRTLDELVAATLILYPRYVDPVTRLPCPPEILVERIARGEATVAAPLAGVRKLQGKLRLAFRGLQRSAA